MRIQIQVEKSTRKMYKVHTTQIVIYLKKNI